MKKYTALLLILFISIYLYGSGNEAHALRDLSTFVTSTAEQDSGVNKNIALACGKINGAVIRKGALFSFNETVGEGSSVNGFVSGRVLYRDKIVMEPGGGLCQVSSTLFNAMLLAGMNIAERHRHYQPVSYVPLGLDAAIKYGKKDLRMRNPYDFDLIIRAEAGPSGLICRIQAGYPPPFIYIIHTEEEENSIPFAETSREIRHGVSVEVYRKKLRGSVPIESALLYKDYYPPAYID